MAATETRAGATPRGTVGAGQNGSTRLRTTAGDLSAAAARRAATDVVHAALIASSAETAAHSDDVDVIAEGLCRHLGVEGELREEILTAARLHDVGKVGIPSTILEKPAALDPSEWEEIKRHTLVGEEILRAAPELERVARLVRHSHESWDGSGYPDGLAGEEIPLGSRIILCADSFHAIRSDRAYRRGRSAALARKEIRRCSGKQFDPQVVEALLALSGETRAHRPRLTARSARLMALLLVVSCGVGAGALANNGLFGGGGSEQGAPPPRAHGAPGAAEHGSGFGSCGACGFGHRRGLAPASPGAELRRHRSLGTHAGAPAHPAAGPGAAVSPPTGGGSNTPPPRNPAHDPTPAQPPQDSGPGQPNVSQTDSSDGGSDSEGTPGAGAGSPPSDGSGGGSAGAGSGAGGQGPLPQLPAVQVPSIVVPDLHLPPVAVPPLPGPSALAPLSP